MKKFLLLSILIICFALPNLADENQEAPSKEIIILSERPTGSRSQNTSISIDAYYQGGAIYLQFGENIGCMDVNITNHSTGEQWHDTACSDNATEVIAISSSLGIYQITLETESGAIYYGSFSL